MTLKRARIGIVGVSLIAVGIFAYRSDWIGGRVQALQHEASGSPSAPAQTIPSRSTTASATPARATAAGTTVLPSSAQAAAGSNGGRLPEGNLALLDAGARIAFTTSNGPDDRKHERGLRSRSGRHAPNYRCRNWEPEY